VIGRTHGEVGTPSQPRNGRSRQSNRNLLVLDGHTLETVRKITIAGGDSVHVSPDGRFAAIANEQDGGAVDGRDHRPADRPRRQGLLGRLDRHDDADGAGLLAAVGLDRADQKPADARRGRVAARRAPPAGRLCTIAHARATKKRARTRLVRAGRAYATGTLAYLHTTLTITRGTYRLRIAGVTLKVRVK